MVFRWGRLLGLLFSEGSSRFSPNSCSRVQLLPLDRTSTSSQRFNSWAGTCFSQRLSRAVNDLAKVTGKRAAPRSSDSLPGRFAIHCTRKFSGLHWSPKVKVHIREESISTCSLSHSHTWLLPWDCPIFSPSKDHVSLNWCFYHGTKAGIK